MKQYNPKEIEPKWQKLWYGSKIYAAVDGDNSRPKFVMLTEFPYPSGEGLHVGHVREYTLGDVIARLKRMQGYNVLMPMGYDAFGLPTENYAIKNKVTPQAATAQNMAFFREQFNALGYSIDWDRQVNTSDPSFYKWTQWLFLRFFKAGLAYQAEIAINWCPKEKTGLANEEVVNGRHERCGTLVEKKLLKQWMLKITDYADRLIEGLKTVDYPDRIASQQINWIGKSTGAEIDFKVAVAASRITASDHPVLAHSDNNHASLQASDLSSTTSTQPPQSGHEVITAYTTRPDTLAGATFMVLAPEHPLVAKITTPEQKSAVEVYVKKVQSESEISRQDTDREKTGAWTGAYTENPITHQQMPIWIADYVLMGYGTGAIMAVPAHDERDFEFAQKFELPVIQVVDGSDIPHHLPGKLMNSDQFDGLDSDKAKQAIVAWLEQEKIGRKAIKYKLRDWIFSRQHYWGEPIPIIHCPKCGAVPVPDAQLPVELPKVEHYEPTDDGRSPLAAIESWVNVDCPKCGGPAKRETDTMPNWAGSSWYYLRYYDPHNDEAFASRDNLEYWREADIYLGGMEHTTLHLLYSRFWHQFLYDQKLVPTPEPYAARRGQGIVLAADGRKMSKSFGNVLNPLDVIERFGADALRAYIMFMAPYDETTAWSDEHLSGVSRFLYRSWDMMQKLIGNNQPSGQPDSVAETEIDQIMHKTIKKVDENLGAMKFNTAISALMECLNGLSKHVAVLQESRHAALAQRTARLFALLLAPIAPHMTEELWEQLGETESIHLAAWPKYNPELVKDELVTVVVQVNGKLRANIVMAVEASEDELKAAAAKDENVQKYIGGKDIVRTVVVPRKLVNFVVK